MSESTVDQSMNGPTKTKEELEREKLEEEIKQLRAGARIKWITPAALATLIPLVVGFGLWLSSEVKQYNEGYRAIAERDELKKEKEEIQKQKDSLNLEVLTLLQLKSHYAAQADRLQRDTEAKQSMIDNTWLRGSFTSWEAVYALEHAGEPQNLDDIRQAVASLPDAERRKLEQVLLQYSFAFDVIDMSSDIIVEFNHALALMPTSEWTKDLQAQPTGIVLRDRKIMSTTSSPKRHYDVTAGRFLTDDEVKEAELGR